MPRKFDEIAKGTLGLNYGRTSGVQPDYTGRLEIDGRTLNLSVWGKRNNSNGQMFWSFVVSEAINTSPDSRAGPPPDPDDEIPF